MSPGTTSTASGMTAQPVSEQVEWLLTQAEAEIRTAAGQFPECDVDSLLHLVADVLPGLVAVARTALERAQDEAGDRFAGATYTTARGIEWSRSRAPRRTAWTDELLPTVLDTRRADENGEVIEETPLEKVLHVWHLGAPRLTALRERGLEPDDFCHVTWADDQPWKVVPSSKKRKAKR